MKKHNAAVNYYIRSWQNMIAAWPLSAQERVWHQGIKPMHADPYAVNALAWQDLGEALRQYEIWQNVPRYQSEGGAEIWREGGSCAQDFGGEGPRVLMVPSMINGHEILNMPDHLSLMNHLKTKGLRPILLLWGNDCDDDHQMGLEDYQSRLQSAFAASKAQGLVGYCLGGTLSHYTPLENLQAQVLLGAPWQFQHEQGRVGLFAKALAQTPLATLEEQFEMMNQNFGVLPSIALDYLFASLNPLQFVQKFRKRGTLAKPEHFDALEDWLTEGRNLPIPLSHKLIFEWFREDALWRSDYQNDTATLAIFGRRDHIAPPISCEAIANSAKNVQLLAHNAGHVGLLVGNQSQRQIWPQIADFLKNQIEQ